MNKIDWTKKIEFILNR